MIASDLHLHTLWCDGKASPAEMACAAFEKGMKRIGFSCHSYTWFDEEYCIARENIPLYIAEIRALAGEYAGRMEILCGVEQDIDSREDSSWADYVIGSVHYIEKNGRYYPIDNSEEGFRELLAAFGGDADALAEAYFAKEAEIVRRTGADIIGHFDLITKFNEGGKLFDESTPRYRAAWQQAADVLLRTGVPFEINTGAISRGYRTEPYPSAEIRSYIRAHGGTLILSSDAHAPENIGYRFDAFEKYLGK